MKKTEKKGLVRCLLLCALMVLNVALTGASSVSLLTAGGVDNNLLGYPVASSQDLKEEFDMGNLLLFVGGSNEQDDNGVIDDSVLTEEGETGEEAQAGQEGDTGQEEVPAEVVSTVGRVIGNNIKLRAQANADSEIVAELNEGATLTITGQEGKWLKVTFGILQGYVHSDYVFEVSENGLNGTILRDGVNLRETGDIAGNVIKQLTAGTGVQVKDYGNGWYQVTCGDKTGYVRSDCITVSGEFTGEAQTRMLKSGMSGDAVKKAQNELKRRGFFMGEASGDYGPKTTQAVKDFQKAAKLGADGVLGEQTLDLLYSSNNIKVTIATASQVKGRVQMTEWSRVNNIIPRGKTLKVIDVRTGVSWNSVRHGGYLHIDAEPLTASDTAKLKSVYGGRWSWNRRAVWVIYGNYVFAGSINGMPHGSAESIGSANNFKGVYCIHFYKSRTHCSNSLDPRHQACILSAYKAGK